MNRPGRRDPALRRALHEDEHNVSFEYAHEARVFGVEVNRTSDHRHLVQGNRLTRYRIVDAVENAVEDGLRAHARIGADTARHAEQHRLRFRTTEDARNFLRVLNANTDHTHVMEFLGAEGYGIRDAVVTTYPERTEDEANIGRSSNGRIHDWGVRPEPIINGLVRPGEESLTMEYENLSHGHFVDRAMAYRYINSLNENSDHMHCLDIRDGLYHVVDGAPSPEVPGMTGRENMTDTAWFDGLTVAPVLGRVEAMRPILAPVGARIYQSHDEALRRADEYTRSENHEHRVVPVEGGGYTVIHSLSNEDLGRVYRNIAEAQIARSQAELRTNRNHVVSRANDGSGYIVIMAGGGPQNSMYDRVYRQRENRRLVVVAVNSENDRDDMISILQDQYGYKSGMPEGYAEYKLESAAIGVEDDFFIESERTFYSLIGRCVEKLDMMSFTDFLIKKNMIGCMRARSGQTYSTLVPNGKGMTVETCKWLDSELDMARLKLGNVFKTEQMLHYSIAKLEAETGIKVKASESRTFVRGLAG